MFRKFMVQLFLFLLLFSTWWELSHLRYVATGGRITNPLPVFPSLQIEMLKSSDPQVVTDALKGIARNLINYLEPELAKEIWECNFLFLDLLPGDAPELVISLTLPPDRGVLVLLQKQNKHYILLYYLDNLLPLTKMESLALPDGSSFLATREEYKERTGAYTEARMVKLWTWKNKALHVVWSDNSYWEINWLNTWQNPQSQPLKWFKLLQEAGITYQGETNPLLWLKPGKPSPNAPRTLNPCPPRISSKLADRGKSRRPTSGVKNGRGLL